MGFIDSSLFSDAGISSSDVLITVLFDASLLIVSISETLPPLLKAVLRYRDCVLSFRSSRSGNLPYRLTHLLINLLWLSESTSMATIWHQVAPK